MIPPYELTLNEVKTNTVYANNAFVNNADKKNTKYPCQQNKCHENAHIPNQNFSSPKIFIKGANVEAVYNRKLLECN